MKVIFMFLIMAISIAASPNAGLFNTATKSEIGKYYIDLSINDFEWREKNGVDQNWDISKCENTFKYIHDLITIDPNSEEIAFKVLAFTHVFDMCKQWNINDNHYRLFLKWARNITPPEERDHFTGECLVHEATLALNAESAARFELISELLELAGAQTTKIYKYKSKANFYLQEVDSAAKTLLNHCSKEASDLTKKTLKESLQ